MLSSSAALLSSSQSVDQVIKSGEPEISAYRKSLKASMCEQMWTDLQVACFQHMTV